ncbi:transposase [Streptomyces sp. NPDC050388]|uniref:transposase n=1 Tax=Streptomyces sp. NPDC050388 TaxID=3155781 RepID=UPI0034346293
MQLSLVNGQFIPRGCPVASPRHDLLRLLESLRSADGLELVREVAERLLQELFEAEATAGIGTEWGERTDTRTNHRNGHREKTGTTRAGAREPLPPHCVRSRPAPGRSGAQLPTAASRTKS